MRRLLAAAAALAVIAAAPPSTVIERPSVNQLAPIVIQLDAVPTGSLVTMLMRDVMRVPYVIAPDVLADKRPMSVRLTIPRNQIPTRVVGFLRKSGFAVELEGGTVYVGRLGRAGSASFGAPSFQPGVPLGSPVDVGRPDMPRAAGPAEYVSTDKQTSHAETNREDLAPASEPDEPQLLAAFIPAHRDPAYLAQLVGAMLPDLVMSARSNPTASSSQPSIDSETDAGDTLVITGSAPDLARARQLLELLDRPRPMVAVKAVVMSVQDIKARGSALSALAGILKGNVELGSFDGIAAGSQFVRIGKGAVSAVLSAVREDSRFRVVATPNLAALSGATATMNAGAQVPTVGAVTIAEGGTPVQSVVYRDSGITLTVRPVVRGELIEMSVREERSTFVRTTTGVSDSPTLQKSSASASVVLKSGESVILAGLTEQSEGATREGLLGGLLGVRSRDKSDSELMVLLSAELVPLPDVAPGQFIDIPGSPKEDDLAPTA